VDAKPLPFAFRQTNVPEKLSDNVGMVWLHHQQTYSVMSALHQHNTYWTTLEIASNSLSTTEIAQLVLSPQLLISQPQIHNCFDPEDFPLKILNH